MNTRPRTFRLRTGLILTALLSLVLAACSSAPAEPATPRHAAGRPPAAVCGNTLPGPAAAPACAVTVDPTVDGDLAEKTRTNPPGTTLWLAPGTHTLGRDQYGQVTPKDGNTYLGAPGGAVVRDNWIHDNNGVGLGVDTNNNDFLIEGNDIEDNDSTAQLCSQPGIATEPRYSDCRWKTQRVDIHDNTFVHDPAVVGCEPGLTGRMAVLSNYGTYPDWSPYRGTVIQEAITFAQRNRWHDNDYVGPWMFTAYDTGRLLDQAGWRAAPHRQDNGSTFTGARDRGC